MLSETSQPFTGWIRTLIPHYKSLNPLQAQHSTVGGKRQEILYSHAEEKLKAIPKILEILHPQFCISLSPQSCTPIRSTKLQLTFAPRCSLCSLAAGPCPKTFRGNFFGGSGSWGLMLVWLFADFSNIVRQCTGSNLWVAKHDWQALLHWHMLISTLGCAGCRPSGLMKPYCGLYLIYHCIETRLIDKTPGICSLRDNSYVLYKRSLQTTAQHRKTRRKSCVRGLSPEASDPKYRRRSLVSTNVGSDKSIAPENVLRS